MTAPTSPTETTAMPQDATDRLKQTYAVLVGDCQEAERLLRTTDTPCLRRAFVRVLSAFVEGMAHQLRCVVREAIEEFPAAQSKCGFTDEEIAWLFEKAKVKTSIRKRRFRTAVVCYAKLYMEPFELNGEAKVDRLAKVRDRITHPRSAADLEISDDDRIDAWAAAEAIIDDMGRLFSICNAKG